jgi:hypothetical protein
MREDGRPIPWSKINMPGRTTKSLQNMWTKIQKEAAALDDGEETPVATPRKSTRKFFLLSLYLFPFVSSETGIYRGLTREKY